MHRFDKNVRVNSSTEIAEFSVEFAVKFDVNTIATICGVKIICCFAQIKNVLAKNVAKAPPRVVKTQCSNQVLMFAKDNVFLSIARET